MMKPEAIVLQGDCLQHMAELEAQGYPFALTFLDPPFNQGKEYAYFDDNLPDEQYWAWMADVCRTVHRITAEGGAVYFMQREKNTEQVLRTLRETDSVAPLKHYYRFTPNLEGIWGETKVPALTSVR